MPPNGLYYILVGCVNGIAPVVEYRLSVGVNPHEHGTAEIPGITTWSKVLGRPVYVPPGALVEPPAGQYVMAIGNRQMATVLIPIQPQPTP